MTIRAFNDLFPFIFTGVGFSSTTGSGFSSTIGSLTTLIFGSALDFDFGFALGLISSSKIVSLTSFLIGSSFTGSSLLIISIISSLVSGFLF